jgi:hypothetical protein
MIQFVEMLAHRIHAPEAHHGSNANGMSSPKLAVEHESACPFCTSQKVLQSKFHGIFERTIFRLLGIYPFWCGTCDSRFYSFSRAGISRGSSEFQPKYSAHTSRIV